MFDPVSLAVGGALAGVGYVAGRVGRRAQPLPVAECGCGHDLALHDPGTQRCHAEDLRPFGQGYAPCSCRQYVGPLPVERLFSTPILPPTPE